MGRQLTWQARVRSAALPFKRERQERARAERSLLRLQVRERSRASRLPVTLPTCDGSGDAGGRPTVQGAGVTIRVHSAAANATVDYAFTLARKSSTSRLKSSGVSKLKPWLPPGIFTSFAPRNAAREHVGVAGRDQTVGVAGEHERRRLDLRRRSVVLVRP